MQYTCYGREPKWLLVAAILLLSACSSAPRQQPAPVSDSGYPAPQTQPPFEDNLQDNGGWRLDEPEKTENKPAVVATPSSAGAVGALLEQAETEYQRGDYQRAIAAAERALRIDRRNGDIYLLLAKSYWQQALPAQSEQFARQGLRYSQSVQLTDALNKVLNEVAGRR